MNVNIKAPRCGMRNINKVAGKIIITAENATDEVRLALLGRLLNATAATQQQFWASIEHAMNAPTPREVVPQ